MNIAMKAICWQNAQMDFHIIQDAYRRRGSASDLIRATHAQLEAYQASQVAMWQVRDLLSMPRPFNAETVSECERIQQEIDQADYNLSRQHMGYRP